eukprot:1157858-Pelagomonas_calceolata.AAC.4
MNLSSRSGRLEEEIEYNKRYKVRLATDTEKGLKGATMGLTAKLQRPYVHSIGMNLSRAAGATLKYEVNFGEDDLVKAKANWKLKGNEACLELQPKISEQLACTILLMPVFEIRCMACSYVLRTHYINTKGGACSVEPGNTAFLVHEGHDQEAGVCQSGLKGTLKA